MSGTRYVNQPGSVIVHLDDGTSEHLKYGDAVPKNVASYVDVYSFSDTSPRRIEVDAQLEAEANRRAAFAEDGQVNSTSSAVPGNYKELDEEGAAILVGGLDRYPEAQAQLLVHEILYCGGRRQVVDAASEAARASAEAQIGAFPDHLKDPNDYTDTEPVPSGLGDPAVATADQIVDRALAAQQGKDPGDIKPKKGGRRGRETPPPTPEAAEGADPETVPGSGASG